VPPRPEVYQSSTQRSFSFMAFVVRTTGDARAAIPMIRRAVAELDPALPLAKVNTMDEHIATKLSRPRFLSTLVTAFGLLAATLAMVGIYGVMSWSVAERRQEFAIRLALGQRGRALIFVVLKKAAVLAGTGIALGLAGASAATRALQGMLYGIEPTDPQAYALMAAILALVALAACYAPARRAIRVDPVTLLR
jgi:putative ABC transport system permease protein